MILVNFQNSVIQLLKIFFLGHRAVVYPWTIIPVHKLLELALMHFVSDQWDFFLREEVTYFHDTCLRVIYSYASY